MSWEHSCWRSGLETHSTAGCLAAFVCGDTPCQAWWTEAFDDLQGPPIESNEKELKLSHWVKFNGSMIESSWNDKMLCLMKIQQNRGIWWTIAMTMIFCLTALPAALRSTTIKKTAQVRNKTHSSHVQQGTKWSARLPLKNLFWRPEIASTTWTSVTGY